MLLNIFSLAYSVFLGWIIGYERKKHDKDGGSRTFSIVCLGACLITILTKEMILMTSFNFDSVRLLSYGLASIGFLLSGLIVKDNNKISGLTTASSLWVLVLIGYCIGLSGRFFVYGNVVAFLLYLILENKRETK